ncbi:hypothetical protein ASG17_03625 [Brevundimonas sp. Leaf363]|nr:hypothetical protein ASG17_03625 [Brevundimonas sp. Leaf363]
MAAVVVAGLHLGLFAMLGIGHALPPSLPAAEPVMVELFTPPPVEPPPPPVATPEPGGAPAADAASEPAAPTLEPATPAPARPRLAVAPPPQVETVAAAPVAALASALPLLGADQLAGALTAGDGGGGGGSGTGAGGGNGSGVGACDMVRRVQDRLRATPTVRTAVAEAERTLNASGRAMLVWNGDWLQSGAQAGKGLAGVRQAIALEVAFAPEACRRQSMRGLAVVSLSDGGPKLALGRAAWRWSDLLGV